MTPIRVACFPDAPWHLPGQNEPDTVFDTRRHSGLTLKETERGVLLEVKGKKSLLPWSNVAGVDYAEDVVKAGGK